MGNSALIPPYGDALVDLFVPERERDELRARAIRLPSIQIPEPAACDLQLLACGAFSPLDRFVGKGDHERILEEMRLLSGHIKVSDDAIEHAYAQVSAGLRHHRVTAAELIDSDVPYEVLSLYLDLCAEAGPIYEQARKVEVSGKLQDNSARANEVSLLLNELQQLRSSLASREQILNEILNSKSFRLISFVW